jgi:hypothetical protein
MPWEKIHTSKDEKIHSFRWESHRGWIFRVEIGEMDHDRVGHTIFVPDPLHNGRRQKFNWRKGTENKWSAKVHEGRLERVGDDQNFSLDFIANEPT